MKIPKLIKAYTLAKIALKEIFVKSVVVKMSVAFNSKGAIIKSNWGDDINYWLFKEISDEPIIPFSLSIITRYFRKPYVTCIGSILTLFDMDNAIVWGTGVISNDEKIAGRPKEVRAVRGPLTRKILIEQGIDCPEVYGDPALLLPLFYQPSVEKKYRLGIIPHYTDKSSLFIDAMRTQDDVIIIETDNYECWLDFVDQINMCENIASSSLHGQIVAQAYGIPNIWLKMDDGITGDGFKYHDFFLSQGFDREAVVVSSYTTKELLLSACQEWQPSMYDIKPLIKAMPFKLKQNLKIQHFGCNQKIEKTNNSFC